MIQFRPYQNQAIKVSRTKIAAGIRRILLNAPTGAGKTCIAAGIVLFAIATRRLPLSMMAFLQYLAPTLAFLIGVLMYHEPLDTLRMLSLAAIWTGLAVYSVDLVKAAAARQEVPLP